MRRAICWAAAVALLATSAAPAEARRWHRHHDDVDAGDVVAGAVVVGGIAAIANAITQGNREKQDAAVDACAGEAENRLGGRISDIGRVSKSKGYYTVEGEVEQSDGGPRQSFSCTVRNGTVYAFRTAEPQA
jgi:predicted secreted Zn-dependent protease